MVNNSYYKCSFCGTTLRLRYQVGYFDISISIYCPKCNCHISGKIFPNQTEGGIKWNDPEIGIVWPDAGEILLSEKDKKHLRLSELLSS